MNYDSIWEKFLDLIQTKVTPVVYNAWFFGTKLMDIKDGTARIIVPYNAVKKPFLGYYDMIIDLLSQITSNVNDMKVYLLSEYEEIIMEERVNSEIINVESNKLEKSQEMIKSDEKEEYIAYNNLIKEYTFDSFVVGDSNRLAWMSSLQVAEKPAVVYNPLFIYGRSGLGKTHLMHAIGNYIVENSDKKVLYVTTEDFIQEFVNITKKDKNKEENMEYIDFFKKKYRDIDVLMIDDIQFLEKANKTQDEFANTFNSLYYNQKQIIISSDTSPNDIKNLEDRLRTRFNWGLTVCIDPPEFDLKVSIIKKKIENEDLYFNIGDDLIQLIATYCGNDVRNIEGSIRRIEAYCAMMCIKELDASKIEEALSDYTTNRDYSSNSVYKIQYEVCKYFKIDEKDLKGKKRRKDICFARDVAMYLCRLMLDETFEEIGQEFGGKNHATVMHSVKKIENDLKGNSQLKIIINDLQKNINVNRR